MNKDEKAWRNLIDSRIDKYKTIDEKKAFVEGCHFVFLLEDKLGKKKEAKE